MKEFVYWLMGDRAGKVTVSTWNWLWGIEAKATPPVSVAPKPNEAFTNAESALAAMERSVDNLAKAVSQQEFSLELAKKKYAEKVRELRQIELSALSATKAGKEDEARSLVARSLQVEKIVEHLECQVKEAEKYVISSQNRLTQEQIKLENYRLEIRNMKDIAEINSALHAIARVHDELDGTSAKSSLEAAKMTIDEYNLQQQTLAAMTNPPAIDLPSESSVNEEIERRLQKMKKSS
jgi:phage shock protein A